MVGFDSAVIHIGAQIAAQHRGQQEKHFQHVFQPSQPPSSTPSLLNRNLIIHPTSRLPSLQLDLRDLMNDFGGGGGGGNNGGTVPSNGPTTFPATTFQPFFPAVSHSPTSADWCPPGKEGYFADVATDCRNYVFCDGHGGKVQHTCPPGMAFNVSLFACDLDIFVACQQQNPHHQRALTTPSGWSVIPTTAPQVPDSGTTTMSGNACFQRRAGYYADFASGCADFYYCAPTGTGDGLAEKVRMQSNSLHTIFKLQGHLFFHYYAL